MPAPGSIDSLCASVADYLDPGLQSEIRRAYDFAVVAHGEQKRRSGEPYITHPLAVAGIMAEMHMDHQCVMAALLHDVLEDTGATKADLAQYFSEEVAELVDGVSKLAQINATSREHAQAENLRKMLLAMTRDIRVILLKLADRLHNMRTLGYVAREKQRRIARETLEIYAPIANRLGMDSIRRELQDLGFQMLYPLRYRILEAAVRRVRGNRKEIVKTIQATTTQRLAQEGPAGLVEGREKSLYSLYVKMRDKRHSLSEIMDIYALRITVDSADKCYRALGVIHNLYKPVPGRFKDYIAIPKANGYQSLHTVLFGPHGVPIEAQIRTHDMERVAEAGIAAHWLYKSGGERTQHRARVWLKGLLEMQQDAGDSLEFLENVKVDLFPDEVYVFTPRGKIMILVRGATAVDFAYAVHTDVGNRCVAAKIDRRLVPLSTPLENGQNVEIITAPTARPSPYWLNFVVTGKARANIRGYLKNLKREESIELGLRLLNRQLLSYSLTLDDIFPERLQFLLKEFGLENLDQLLEAVGLGNRPALLVARRLVPDREAKEEEKKLEAGDSARQPLRIKGTEGMVLTFAKCCRPIPGDPIRGFVTAGRGIVIHTERCKNLAEFRGRPECWTEVEWAEEVRAEFPVEIRVDVENRRGVLATVAATISDTNTNIDNVSLDDQDGTICSILFTLEVRSRYQLAHIMRRLRTLDMVLRIVRGKH
ncbi:RelA/SpoT protein [Nitrosococcus oceani ATCC 19707]|uniref:guanosine-3',5'-bis(diphosphate) 3'-diphosphatase n=2 Tax=Nitrosococcus oceani TaxID=1229 RepID=Q3JBT1_NITOC|nr:RelA/SpoT family protein [Nitrosococcus oceani]ABA57715.1 RelA/SpoT protein [Nitrosococcus oceani ATCC 19707]EDZ67718.1 RelA/SpoT family protein [Nitrosococcus oceani AFC27]KFI19885.1 (p)ppGpp synthetase [Nitrosococcus oceani C-27]GEM19368.1 bifunctional GTP diphosphokinase/guanosine-3',5'-bis(diphosphate) 3'-diphosphatase [Nitrosococcus oceani]